MSIVKDLNCFYYLLYILYNVFHTKPNPLGFFLVGVYEKFNLQDDSKRTGIINCNN